MGSLILLLFVAIIVFSYIRFTKRNRERWLKRINLVGVWGLENTIDEVRSFEFRGSLSSGTYTFESGNRNQRGDWVIVGTCLKLVPNGGDPFECDLRFFDTGKIGIDGPGHERTIYLKRADNVVLLKHGPRKD